MIRLMYLALVVAGLVWAMPAPARADGTTLVTGKVMGGDRGPVVIRVRGEDGYVRDIPVSSAGTFVMPVLRDQTYIFQAQRAGDAGSAATSVLSHPVSVYLYEGARYFLEFPYPEIGQAATPRAIDQQVFDVRVFPH